MRPPEASSAGQEGAFERPLPGIQTEVGLRFCADNRAIFLRMLVRFRDTKGELCRELRQALADGDTRTAARIAHTMKSTAMAIGAVALSETSKALEAALEEAPADEAEALLEAFEARLGEVLAGLRDGLP